MHQVDHAIRRFPAQVERVRRLYLLDERFRAICEDLALAETSLRSFQSRPDARLRPEIKEYLILLSELEEELRNYLASNDP